MTNPRDKSKNASMIATSPRGLQDLLGNINQGVNPHDLSHTVSGVIDLTPFWSTDKLQMNANLGAITAVGDYVSFEVPTGEVWRPVNVTAHLNSQTANDETRLSVVYKDPTGRVFSLVDGDLYTEATGNDLYYLGYQFTNVMLLPSGWTIGAVVNQFSHAGAENLTVRLAYVRLRA